MGALDIQSVRSQLNSGANTINIRGNWNNNGFVFLSTGVVNFNGTANQTIKRTAAAGETFNNLNIDNANGVKLLSNVTTNGFISLTQGELEGSTRVITCNGNLTGSGQLSFSSGTINLFGLNSTTGIFTKGTSTFNYTGTISQTIRAVDYHNLSSNSTGARVLSNSGIIRISGAFAPGTNSYTVTGSTVEFNGTASQTIPVFQFNNLTSTSSGSRILASGTIGVTGNFVPGTNSYSIAGNTMNFNGTSGTQTTNAFTFNNLTKSNASTLDLNGAITVNSNFAITGGAVNTNTFQITGNPVNLFTMAAGTTIRIGLTTSASVVNWPTNYTTANTTLNCASTQIYQGNYAQVVSTVPTYGFLQVNSGAASVTKTLSSTPLNVCADLTTGNNVTLNIAASTVNLTGSYIGTGSLSATSGIFNIAGNWNNSGTFTSGTSTVNYNGGSSQLVGAVNYYNLNSGAGVGTRTLANTGTIGVANIFTPGSNVYTIAGSTVNFNGSGAQVIPAFNYNNLTSSSSGTRTLANSGTIGVASVFSTGTNTYTVTGSTVEFNGAGAQSSSAFTYNNLTVNKSSGSLGITGNINIINDVTLTNGNLNTTGFDFTLLSTTTQTGRIAPITGGTITGSIIMQRTAPGGTTGWAWIGSPITNTTLQDLYNEIPMSGFPGVSYAGNFISVYSYDETVPGLFDAPASYVAPTNVTDPMPIGQGYWIYLGNGFGTTTDMTFDTRGTVNTGDFSFNISYTNSGNPSEDGWNLVANPYPSAIDWDASSFNFSKTSISNTYYTYNTDINNYVTYTTGIGGTNGGTRFIPSSQGFYVKASSVTADLSIKENAKASAQPTYVRMSNSNTFNGNISIKVNKIGSLLADEALFRIDENATNSIDDYDMYKLYPFGDAVNVSTKLDNYDMTINSKYSFDHSFNLPIKVSATSQGMLQLTLNGLEHLLNTYPQEFANDYLVLEDELGNVTNVMTNNTINIMSLPNDSVHNFTLRFNNPTITSLSTNLNNNDDAFVGTDANGLFVKLMVDKSTNVQVEVNNSLGQTVYNNQIAINNNARNSIKMNKVAEGIYFVTLKYNDKVVTKKVKL
jgi:hypothetical protein